MMRKKAASISIAVVLLLLIISSLLVYRRIASRPRTDDAFLEANVVHLAPEVSGRIVALNVRNNQLVHSGDVLFVIDPQPFRLKLAAARAQTNSLKSKIADTANEVDAQESRAEAAHSAVGDAHARLTLAENTLARITPLLSRGFVTAQQVDQARTTRDSARIALTQARQQARAARQAVQSVHPLQAQLEASQAAMALAARDLEKSVVRAPFDGKVIGLNLSVGEYALSGHPLFTLIDTSKWYAVANFRETEISRMAPGTPAKVYLMSQPQKALSGRVESIGWGVTPDDATLIDGMPRVAKTLDWVRLAQRFPVRILLDSPPQNAMRIGASAVVVVRYGD
jgi:multidrug efflux system membrane fusion protein